MFAQSAPDADTFKPYIEHTADMFSLRMQVRDIVVAAGVDTKGDVKQQENVMARAKNAGQELVKST